MLLLGLTCLAISLLYFNLTDLDLFADDFLTWNMTYQAKNVTELFGTTFNPEFYRPLELALVRLNLAASGFNPFLYHLITLVGHLLSSLALYYLARRAKFSFTTALVAMLVFGVSHVNAMAVLGNDTAGQVYSSLFGLLAISQLVGKEELEWKSLVFSSALLFVSLLWKDSGITYVAVAMAISLRRSFSRARYSDSLKYFAPFLAVLTIYLLLRYQAGAIGTSIGETGRYQLWFGLNIPKNIVLMFGAMLTPLGTTVLLAHRTDPSLIAAGVILLLSVVLMILYGLYLTRKNGVATLSQIVFPLALLFLLLFPDCLMNRVSELYIYKPNGLFALLLAHCFITIYADVPTKSKIARALLMGCAICFLVCNVLSAKHKEELMRVNGIRATQMIREIKQQVPKVPKGTPLIVSNLDGEPELVYSVFYMHGVTLLGAGSFYEMIYGSELPEYRNIPSDQLLKSIAGLNKPAMVVTYDKGRIKAELKGP